MVVVDGYVTHQGTLIPGGLDDGEIKRSVLAPIYTLRTLEFLHEVLLIYMMVACIVQHRNAFRLPDDPPLWSVLLLSVFKHNRCDCGFTVRWLVNAVQDSRCASGGLCRVPIGAEAIACG